MSTEREYQELFDKIGALEASVADRLSGQLIEKPHLADQLVKKIDDMLSAIEAQDAATPPPPDGGVASLAGLGPEAARTLGDTRIPYGIRPYDETVNSERLLAVADLYYLYQHERLGVFRVVQKLQELFRAGTVMLSSGDGAYGLYRFDRRQVLRYTRHDRAAAYRRVFGYGAGPTPRGAQPNSDFHRMFTHFNEQVALFWRDKRVADVMRERKDDPSFGSIAVVRRAGLDLRNNLKFTSFGHLNVMRVELMQLLEEAFKILEAEDVRKLFGADTAWDVVETILVRHFGERLQTSPRQRMGVSGREVLRWLSRPHILQSTRSQFEALLLDIADHSEEWLTSAQSLGAERGAGRRRVMRTSERRPVGIHAPRNGRRPAPVLGP